MTYGNSKFNLLKYFLLAVILILSIFTRFIPNAEGKPGKTGLIFDEAYFIPQTEHYFVGRYYFDIHPPLAKLLFAAGANLTTENLVEKVTEHKDILRNKVDGFTTVMNLDGVRLAPKILGTLTPAIVFLLMWNILTYGFRLDRNRKDRNLTKNTNIINTFIAFMVALAVTLENSFIVEARFALITQILIFFIVLTLYFSIKYLYSSTKASYLWITLIGLCLGFALSTKWLALSIIPAVFMIFVLKEYRNLVARRDEKYKELIEKYRDNLSNKITKIVRYVYDKLNLILEVAWRAISKVLLLLPTVLVIYISIYAIHFSKFSYIEPEDSNRSDLELFCPKCVSDLDNDTHTTTIFDWVIATTQIAEKYNKGVPTLDYGKSDEIGSEWLKWPIMARPIIGYWQSWIPSDPNTDYSFFSLIGNPFNWILSMIGIIGLFVISVAKLFGMKSDREPKDNRQYLLYFLVLLLYFSNWLPFAAIPRVMYLYHYLPAMLFGIIAFGLLVQYLFKLDQLSESDLVEKQEPETRRDIFDIDQSSDQIDISISKLFIITIVSICIIISFATYMSFTYALPTSKSMFEMRSLIKDWNMKWPGNR